MRRGFTIWARISVRRATLLDANAQRPVAIFAELLAVLMQQAHRGLRRKLAETTYLIDATSVRLNDVFPRN
jgi:hypothetical protein